jgi:cation transport regulator
MPYSHNIDLPVNIRSLLPVHAQDIYRSAFNNAWKEYNLASKRRSNASQEEVSFRVAWAAVKSKYEKIGGRWTPKY